jgi:6-phosphogluconolactonase
MAHAAAICGGRAVGEVFGGLVRLGGREPGTLFAARFFWADERCAPPTSAESNFAGAKRLLLDPLSIPPGAIHRIEGELPPAEAVARINAEVERELGAGPAGMPVFDLILLSMGEDGHVASLFPGAVENAAEAKVAYRFVLGAKPPPERITLSYAAIAAAKRVLVLVSETDKAPALAKSLQPGGATPLARVIQLRAETEVLTAFPVQTP